MKAVIHIGTEKTGTTTLQEFLHVNRYTLQSNGIAYLKSPGLRNHRKIATFCMDYNPADDQVQSLELFDNKTWQDWKEKFKQQYFKELDGLHRNINTVIISSEHFHSRLGSCESVSRLLDLLSRNFSDIKILVYLRRQDEVAVSLFSTAIKRGIITSSIFPKVNKDNLYFNYEQLLSKWSGVFGHQNVCPRIFEKKKLLNQDLISDFMKVCGIHEFANEFVIPGKKNETLSAYTQEFMSIFNKNCICYSKEKPKQINRLRSILIEELQQIHPGTPHLPSREHALQFYSKFEQSNQKVAEDWFDGKLFDLDFSKYPTVDSQRNKTIAVDDVMSDFINVFKRLLGEP